MFEEEEEEEEDCVVWFCATVAITISDFFLFFFLVKFILVIRVSYYITLYLNDVVNSCVRFGHTVCVRTEEM